MKINNLEIKNRFVRSATYDGYADENGYVTEKQIQLFSDLAEGGVGLIITGIVYVHDSGQIFPNQNSITRNDHIYGLKRLTDTVHERGVKIAVQLFHAGRQRARHVKNDKEQAIAPSYIEDDPYIAEKYRAITENEIWEIIHAFGDAAIRARNARFDAVQLHGAHGYLLSQFLSPQTNHRDDNWGGDLENRLRFHKEIYKDIRSKIGEDYPILIKIGVEDGFPGGLQFVEGEKVAQLLASLGFNALEISQGLRGKRYEGTEFRTKINRIDQEAYFRDWTKKIKSKVDIPVMMVGGLRTFELMEKIIEDGEADFISLCRPLIREPGIVNDWKSGDHHRATCISCNKCLGPIVKGEALYCVQKKKELGGA